MLFYRHDTTPDTSIIIDLHQISVAMYHNTRDHDSKTLMLYMDNGQEIPLIFLPDRVDAGQELYDEISYLLADA